MVVKRTGWVLKSPSVEFVVEVVLNFWCRVLVQRCVDLGLKLSSDFRPLFSNASGFYLAIARQAILDWANSALDLLQIVFQRQEHGLIEPVTPLGSGVRLIRRVQNTPQVLRSLLKGAGERQVVGQTSVCGGEALILAPHMLSASICDC